MDKRVDIMSFSGEIKEELSKHSLSAKHCQIAELCAMLLFGSKITIKNDNVCILFRFELKCVAERCAVLIKRLFHKEVIIIDCMKDGKKSTSGNYHIEIADQELCLEIAKSTKTLQYLKSFMELDEETVIHAQELLWSPMILQQSCCKRAFLRAVFMVSGSISNPEKGYHYEIVTNHIEFAKELSKLFEEFDIEAKIVARKKYFVVYMKEGTYIVDALNVMGAHNGLMRMENIRIKKEYRNTINRQVNCETANINKTVQAAKKQIKDIEYIEKKKGLSYLPDPLREVAQLRLEDPEASLSELGAMLVPPVSRSGVNHRLKKISNIADEIREKDYEQE